MGGRGRAPGRKSEGLRGRRGGSTWAQGAPHQSEVRCTVAPVTLKSLLLAQNTAAPARVHRQNRSGHFLPVCYVVLHLTEHISIRYVVKSAKKHFR